MLTFMLLDLLMGRRTCRVSAISLGRTRRRVVSGASDQGGLRSVGQGVRILSGVKPVERERRERSWDLSWEG